MRLWPVLSLALFGCIPAPATHCHDGVLNGDESDVDCGGSCAGCVVGHHCLDPTDCASGVCSAGEQCVAGSNSGLPDSTGAQVYHVDPGASVIVMPGTVAGYGITANTGGSFRIVWTGDAAASGTFTTFTGTVWTTASITSVTPGCSDQSCALESGDTVSAVMQVSGGSIVTFDTSATTGLDGFDFVVSQESASQPIYFDLYIDGAHRTDHVYFTSKGNGALPVTDPFGLTTAQ